MWAHGSAPRAAGTHCFSSLQSHPTERNTCLGWERAVNNRGKGFVDVMIILQMLFYPDSTLCICEDAAADRPERQLWASSDGPLFFMLKQLSWRADISPSLVW